MASRVEMGGSHDREAVWGCFGLTEQIVFAFSPPAGGFWVEWTGARKLGSGGGVEGGGRSVCVRVGFMRWRISEGCFTRGDAAGWGP